jgi:uncharacterized protein (DUF2252 family)
MLSPKEKKAIARMFETPDVCELVTSLKNRPSHGKVKVVDAAYWMKGCSSLGRLRYAVLLRVGKGDYQDGGLCLIDIKEAVKSASPRATPSSMPRNNAQRVVQGACQLSPFLGQRMLATNLLDREVFIRELLPQDLKLELDQITREEAASAARYLGSVVGKAHGRQMDVPTRRKWRDDLAAARSEKLDAPSWLWTSVVQLVASHEGAYLEHCRQYAR